MAKNIEGQTFEIKYNGMLADTDNVFLHYGYENWENVSECKMRKLKSGCKAEITLPANSELNFCFRNADGYWDNNYGNDYCFTPSQKSAYSFIEIKNKVPKTTTTTAKKETSKKVSTSCNTITKSKTAKTVTKKVK